MNQKLGAMLLALSLVSTGAAACEDVRDAAIGHGPLLSEALAELRAERDRQMRAQAQHALARLRSETETALAQGSSTPAGPSVRTGP